MGTLAFESGVFVTAVVVVFAAAAVVFSADGVDGLIEGDME